jgi:hypothetical protein
MCCIALQIQALAGKSAKNCSLWCAAAEIAGFGLAINCSLLLDSKKSLHYSSTMRCTIVQIGVDHDATGNQ